MSDENDEGVLKRLTVRELRARAVKALGSKVAAGLKLKQELVDALVAGATKVAKKADKVMAAARKSPPKAAAKSPPKAAAAKSPPKKAAEKAPEPEVAPEPVKKSAPAKKAAPKASAPRKAAAASAKAIAPTPPRVEKAASKPSKSEKVAEVYELPITRDFFVDPRRGGLPVSYGDDRLLCFRREPLAIVVSWDLSTATFADGQALSLELVTHKGRLVGSVAIGSPTGLTTFDKLPSGHALTVQVVRAGRVVTRGRPFMIGGVAEEESDEGRPTWQMTVPMDQPIPRSPERRVWADAPPRTTVTRKVVKRTPAESSRLGAQVETEETETEQGAGSGRRRRASSSRISS